MLALEESQQTLTAVQRQHSLDSHTKVLSGLSLPTLALEESQQTLTVVQRQHWLDSHTKVLSGLESADVGAGRESADTDCRSATALVGLPHKSPFGT